MNKQLRLNVEFYKKGLFHKIAYVDKQAQEVVKLHPKQVQALQYFTDDKTKYIGYGGSARGGKTILIDAAILFECYAYPGTRYLLARKELINMFQTTWKTMQRLFNNFDIKEKEDYTHNQQTHTVTFLETGSEIILLDASYRPSDSDITRLGSLEVTKACIDQSEQIHPKMIEKIGERVGNQFNLRYNLKGKVLEVFNPARTHVYGRYWKPYKAGNETENRRFVRALPTDNPGAEAKRWVKEKQKDYESGDMSEAEYQKQILGNFDFETDPNVLFEFNNVLDLFTNEHVSPDPASRYITTDIAMQGSDLFTIFVWYGWAVVDIIAVAKSGGARVIQEIKKAMAKHSVYGQNVVYDSDGVGAFVGTAGGFIPSAKPFVNNASPMMVQGEKEQYRNLKAQCAYRIAKRVEKHQVLIMDRAIKGNIDLRDKIAEEIAAIKKDGKEDTKLGLCKKDQMRQALGGRSPDYADSFIMREYIEVCPVSRGRRSVKI